MTTPFPAPADDPTVDPNGSRNLIGPRLPIHPLGTVPETTRPWWYVLGIMIGQIGIFIGLMGPATISIQVKAQTLSDVPAEQASITAFAVAPGAIAAMLFNPIGGRISDRTTGRLGRRRPWLILGVLGMVLGLALIAIAPSAALMAVGWFVAQATANLAFASFTASLADQLPRSQYGKVSGLVGIAQNLAVMFATWMAAWLSSSMILLFLVPAIAGAVCVVVYALMIPEAVLVKNRHPFNLMQLVQTFWRNPLTFPDFGLAWGGRFTIILAAYLFTTFRQLYMTNHIGLERDEAVAAVAIGVTIYTVVSMGASYLAGWLSDLLGRRKIIVAVSMVIFGVATYMLLHADTVAAFYVVEAVMGLAYGAYIAVDLALILEVLPVREEAGKDLGVINMANALPQSLAPAMGGFLLANIGNGTDFTALLTAAMIAAAIGAVMTMLIRGVR